MLVCFPYAPLPFSKEVVDNAEVKWFRINLLTFHEIGRTGLEKRRNSFRNSDQALNLSPRASYKPGAAPDGHLFRRKSSWSTSDTQLFPRKNPGQLLPRNFSSEKVTGQLLSRNFSREKVTGQVLSPNFSSEKVTGQALSRNFSD